MRKNLLDLLTKTIVFEYSLTNSPKGIDKTIFTTHTDECFSSKDPTDFATIIYNSIIEYSFNEFDIAANDFDNLHAIALKTKIRYDAAASDDAKLKYGFFGEVLLFGILCVIYKAKPIIARGYFFNPLESAETKGYDSYHLVEHTSKVELWFGEVKLHSSYKGAISSALQNIEKAISDDYLSKNILAITNHKNNLNYSGSQIEKIIQAWENDPAINLIDEIKKYNMELVYPILIVSEMDSKGYDESIKNIIKHIKDNYTTKKFGLSINFKIFFILLPVEEVKKIKTTIISWIDSKQPLMS